MIALVSSTIFPGDATVYAAHRSLFSPEERLSQTRHTIETLQANGFSDIYLADNSGPNWVDGTDEQLAPARVFHFSHYQFQNRGISELFCCSRRSARFPKTGRSSRSRDDTH